MKTLLIGLFLLFASDVCAQTLPCKNCELPRRSIKPYATVEEALISGNASSRYITSLTEWQRSENNGNISFSTTYVYPAAWLNRQLILCVESASGEYTVSINGSFVGNISYGTDPTEFNITKKSQQGINELQITVSGKSDADTLLSSSKPELGKVYIVSQPTIRVRDIDYSTRLNDSGDAITEFNIAVKTDALNPKTARIHYELLAPDSTRLAYGYKDTTIEMRGEDTVSFSTIVPAKLLWSIHNPNLLKLVVRNQVESRYAENIAVPIGVREVEYADKKLSVNGKSTALRIATVPATISAKDIADFKVQGYNTIMVQAGVTANNLYDICDSVGIYIIPQAAIDTSHGVSHIKLGGNPSNNPAWKEFYLARMSRMYHTTKSHPSVIAFSMGGGNTNGINMYESYLMLKSLEQNRPVIYLGAGSEWNNDAIEGSIMPTIEK